MEWLIIFVYFFPTLNALKSRYLTSIFIINLFLGWTFIGWVVALAWSVMPNPPGTENEKNSIQKFVATIKECRRENLKDQPSGPEILISTAIIITVIAIVILIPALTIPPM